MELPVQLWRLRIDGTLPRLARPQPREPQTMNKTFVNTFLAVMIGGLAVEFLVNRTPVGDIVSR